MSQMNAHARGITPDQACKEGWFTPNTSGLCGCGCGEQTSIARVTDKSRGRIKGQHLRFKFGHFSRTIRGKQKGITIEQAIQEGWYRPNMNNGLCHCGCGKTAPISSVTRRSQNMLAGYPTQYILGHNQRGKTGINSYVYRGGRAKTGTGYMKLLRPDHPNANKGGYVLEHRIIMEQYLNRLLQSNETVHHKNGIRDDNRIENLELRVGPHGPGATHCWNCGASLTP